MRTIIMMRLSVKLLIANNECIYVCSYIKWSVSHMISRDVLQRGMVAIQHTMCISMIDCMCDVQLGQDSVNYGINTCNTACA